MRRSVFTVFFSLLVLALGAAIFTTHSQAAQVQAGVSHQASVALIKRGEYLARLGDCIACHSVRNDAPYAGGLALPTPFGTLYSPNITADPETGIGQWSADDFYRAMHNGVSKKGYYLYPAFPFTSYAKVTREDSDAIFAYLTSLKPVHRANREHDLPFPFNQRIMLLGWRLLFFHDKDFKPDPKQSALWNRGAYLVNGLGHCAMCHTSINALGGNNQSSAFAGGLIPLQNWYAPALTSTGPLGVSDRSVKDLMAILTTGVSKHGAVFGPMAEVVHDSLQYLSTEDARAIATYLKTLPQKKAAPHEPQFEVPTYLRTQLFTQGSQIYAQHCVSCHSADGRGLPNVYPALAGNRAIQMPSAVNAIRMVLHGGYPPSTRGNPTPHGMPPFAQTLSDHEIAAVVSYIRQAWNDQGSSVSPNQVSQLRAAPLD